MLIIISYNLLTMCSSPDPCAHTVLITLTLVHLTHVLILCSSLFLIIRPHNVLITDAGRAKLSDMGLSKQLCAEQHSFESLGAGKVIGVLSSKRCLESSEGPNSKAMWDVQSLDLGLFYFKPLCSAHSTRTCSEQKDWGSFFTTLKHGCCSLLVCCLLHYLPRHLPSFCPLHRSILSLYLLALQC